MNPEEGSIPPPLEEQLSDEEASTAWAWLIVPRVDAALAGRIPYLG
jgi:hypothetical protein